MTFPVALRHFPVYAGIFPCLPWGISSTLGHFPVYPQDISLPTPDFACFPRDISSLLWGISCPYWDISLPVHGNSLSALEHFTVCPWTFPCQPLIFASLPRNISRLPWDISLHANGYFPAEPWYLPVYQGTFPVFLQSALDIPPICTLGKFPVWPGAFSCLAWDISLSTLGHFLVYPQDISLPTPDFASFPRDKMGSVLVNSDLTLAPCSWCFIWQTARSNALLSAYLICKGSFSSYYPLSLNLQLLTWIISSEM